jgi:hypothetical protein
MTKDITFKDILELGKNPKVYHFFTIQVFIFYIVQFIIPGIIPIYYNYWLSFTVMVFGQFLFWKVYYKKYRGTPIFKYIILNEIIFHYMPFIYFSRYPPPCGKDLESVIFDYSLFALYLLIIPLKNLAIYADPEEYLFGN